MKPIAPGTICIYIRPGTTRYGEHVTVLAGPISTSGTVMDQLTGQVVGSMHGVYHIAFPDDPIPGMSLCPDGELRRWVSKRQWLKPIEDDAPALTNDFTTKVKWSECLWQPQILEAA